jgi:cell wall-associated NlpC family hydrolase
MEFPNFRTALFEEPMKRYGLFLVLPLLISGCGLVKKNTSYSETPRVHVDAAADAEPASVPESEGIEDVTVEEDASETGSSKVDEVIESAMEYTGVRYKYGGVSKKGMDCSGLLYVSFLENDIPLPRTSDQMAEKGKRIKVSRVQKGDLLFFKTQRGGKKINHVGLVVQVEGDEVKFIHSTTSRGVIVSSLREGYWNYAFVKATRIF